MSRAIFDTGLYIDWINAGKHTDLLFERSTVKYMSAVVLMELHAGAFSPKDAKLVRTVATAFRRVGRVITPSMAVWEEAGAVLRVLQGRGYRLAGAHGLANDVLIALSARSIGATVFTANVRDFRAIHSVRPFELVAV
jgi:predicted nucleic acid-binding protein